MGNYLYIEKAEFPNSMWDTFISFLDPTTKQYRFHTSATIPLHENQSNEFLKNAFKFATTRRKRQWTTDQYDLLDSLNSLKITNNDEDFSFLSRHLFKTTSKADHTGMETFFIALPDFNDQITRRFMKLVGWKNFSQLTQNDRGMTMQLKNIPLSCNVVDVSLNIIDYSDVGGKTIQLLRRVKRHKDDSHEVIQYANVQYQSLITNDIRRIKVTLTGEDYYPAHVYDKNQIVLDLKEKL